MDVIRPKTMTDSILISSNVPELDQAQWNVGVTYSIGAMVMVVTGGEHRIYESLQSANTGHTPKTSPTWWLDRGATNRWMMFDSAVSTQTVVTGNLVFTLAPGNITSIGLINMDGASVSLSMVDGTGAVVYSNHIELRLYNADSLHEYFFKPIEYKRFLVLNDLPNYYEGKLTVTITPGVDGLAKCGLCVVGQAFHIGDLQYGSGGGSTDYSTVTTDVFGVSTATARVSASKLTGQVLVEPVYVDSVNRFMNQLSGIMCLYSGSDVFESSVIFGFRKDFTFAYTDVSHSIFNIEVQGIT